MAGNLAKLSGKLVTLTTTSGVVSGRVFAFDQPTNTLVLQYNTRQGGTQASFSLINGSAITNVLEDNSDAKEGVDALVGIRAVDPAKQKTKEAEQVYKAKLRADKIKNGVSKETQTLFFELDKYISCKWGADNSMIVADTVVVDQPYDLAHVRLLKPPAAGEETDPHTLKAVERVKKIIETIQKKVPAK